MAKKSTVALHVWYVHCIVVRSLIPDLVRVEVMSQLKWIQENRDLPISSCFSTKKIKKNGKSLIWLE